MRSLFAALALSGVLAVIPGCATRTRANSAEPTTTVVVENQSTFEMTVYVVRGAERVRLGTSRPITETRFRIPAGIVFGPTTLRFQADPIGSTRAPITQEIVVTPGDQVRLRIPPS
jgi:hypothetical protein